MRKFILTLFLSMFFVVNSVYATNVKVTALTEETAPIATDLAGAMVDDPGGTPISKKVTFANLFGSAANIGAATVVTTGALNAGSITSGFGTIDNGASNITTTGDITGGTHAATSDTAASDNASMGYTAAEGLILTGQGSTNDITVKNDADADVWVVPTGTTNVDIVGTATASTFEPDGDTASDDNAAIGYTSTEGIIVTGQGSTNDVTIKNDADAIVAAIQTGTTNFDIVGVGTAATFEPDGDTAAADNAAIGYTVAEGIIITGQGSTNDVTVKNDADADVWVIPTGTTNVDIVGTTTASIFAPDGDVNAGMTAAIGYASADGVIITGQGSTNDVSIRNDADANVIVIPTGTTTPTIADDTTLTTGTIIIADGGTVTQITDRTTGVTLNTHSGQITTDNTSLAAGAEVTFTVSNSIVTAVDAIIVSISDSPDADSLLSVFVTDIGAGTFDISYSNVSANADTGAVVINYVVIRGASS